MKEARLNNPDDVRAQRRELQQRLTDWLDVPLTVLALVMLGLLVLQLTTPLSPVWAARVTQVETSIWVVFIAVFALELSLAPSKLAYLRQNWLTALSVVLPALRAVRILRVARVLRGLSLLRLMTTLNRGTRALEHVLRKGQLTYVLAAAALVTLTAAAGALYFERDAPSASIRTAGEALWWAATIITTINSPLEAVTLEGRIIAFMLRIFGLAFSGYLTAIIAVYLLGAVPGQDADRDDEGQRAELQRLRADVARLEQLVEQRLPEQPSPPAPRRVA
jgi:voltage-gated potassium channel